AAPATRPVRRSGACATISPPQFTRPGCRPRLSTRLVSSHPSSLCGQPRGAAVGGKLLALVLALTLSLAVAACGGGEDAGGTVAATGPSGFRTRTPAVLTVGTELPNPPFVLGDDLDPLTGGFEV